MTSNFRRALFPSRAGHPDPRSIPSDEADTELGTGTVAVGSDMSVCPETMLVMRSHTLTFEGAPVR